jgi:hypothetical protein
VSNVRLQKACKLMIYLHKTMDLLGLDLNAEAQNKRFFADFRSMLLYAMASSFSRRFSLNVTSLIVLQMAQTTFRIKSFLRTSENAVKT